MKPLELAKQYMEIIFSEGDMGNLKDLFVDDLTFRGPLYKFTSAEEYIQSLKSNPLKESRYKIIETFENESSVCLVYEFAKPDISTLMVQLFRIRDAKISEISLIFDARDFTERN